MAASMEWAYGEHTTGTQRAADGHTASSRRAHSEQPTGTQRAADGHTASSQRPAFFVQRGIACRKMHKVLTVDFLANSS
ncbi:hypothetical protein M655_005630 [Brevibacillus sp. NSP2.1]|uniref:hypothetical protein n=1 Tax=Brevibacillus sp. NSP2.1 TaxID=3003229 RepID=UPI0004281ADD|nr:hypothetical protein [Brevibacillus sp. NSP2.1]QHZ55176.1 hypothetical protein M655_005630 [Brevibacillus sp. NSP2.1]